MIRSALLLALALSAAGGEADPATALRLGAGDPALATLAAAIGDDQLLALLADADADRRQGAARLCAHATLAPERLLPALIASSDPAVRRLGAARLRGAPLPVAELLRLELADVIAPLLGSHPATDVATQAQAELARWLDDPRRCEWAVAVITARGDAATWGPPLIARLAAKDEVVAATAHAGLEHLTGVQRSRAIYAGNADILQQDWRDTLAKRGTARPTATPADLALIARLPEPAALTELLGRGPDALPAFEAALADRTLDAGRRRQVAAAARLANRAVSPVLYEQLGDAGLADMDAATPAARRACLLRTVATVRTQRDFAGLRHLLTWIDDADAGVRVAALDQLVRLSDERSVFKEWRIGGHFPEADTVWRLRGRLQQGSVDERQSAMIFAVTLHAEALRGDIAAQLLAREGAVVDAALDALGHLRLDAEQTPTVLRLAQDQAAPAARRAKAIELVAGTSGGNDTVLVALEQLTADTDALIASAAARAISRNGRDATRSAAAVERLIARGAIDSAISVALGQDDVAPLRPLLPLLKNDALAAKLAGGLLGKMQEGRSERAAVTGLFDAAASTALATDALPERRALAVALGTLDGVAFFDALPPTTDRAIAWQALCLAPRRAALVLALCADAQRQARTGTPVSERELTLLLNRTLGTVGLEPQRLAAIAGSGYTWMLRPLDSDQNRGGDGKQSLQLTFEDDAATLTRSDTEQNDSWRDSDIGTWTVTTPPKHAPNADEIAAIATALTALALPEGMTAERDLIAAFCGAPPTPRMWSQWKTEEYLTLAVVRLRPELRPALLAAINTDEQPAMNEVLTLAEAGETALLPTVLRAAQGLDDDDRWRTDRLMRWLKTMPADALRPHLPALVGQRALAQRAETIVLIRAAAPVPLALALPLLAHGRLSGIAVAPYGAEATAELAAGLERLDAAQVLAATAALRQLRTAGPAAFDAALAPLASRQDALGAAWLRSGLPLQAGMQRLYDQALASDQPEVWLVGAAVALKAGTLSAADFLDRCARLPAAQQGDAAVIAARYLEGKLAGEAARLATLLRAGDARSAISWLALCPPATEIQAALVARVPETAFADSVGPILADRRRSDPAWAPVVAAAVAAAQGRLDYLAPRK